MKRLSLLPVIVSFTAFAFSANAQQNNVQQAKNNMTEQPYKVQNSNLRIGNMAYAQKVLQAWKDFDNNTLDNSANLFTDDILATFPDGSVVKGKDNFMKMGKDYRNSLTGISTTVDACTTLVGDEHPETQAVTIWGASTETHKDGTSTITHMNEIWFFNKDGKVYEFHQMAAKENPQSK